MDVTTKSVLLVIKPIPFVDTSIDQNQFAGTVSIVSVPLASVLFHVLVGEGFHFSRLWFETCILDHLLTILVRVVEFAVVLLEGLNDLTLVPNSSRDHG